MLLTKVVAIAMLLTLAATVAAGSTVLCFGSDGHIRAEPESADHHPIGRVALDHDAGGQRLADGALADHAPCMDVRLGLATDSKPGDHLAQTDLVLPEVLMSAPAWFTARGPMSIGALPAVVPGLDGSFAALSSTVLRI